MISYIQNRVVTNCVIKRSRCTIKFGEKNNGFLELVQEILLIGLNNFSVLGSDCVLQLFCNMI